MELHPCRIYINISTMEDAWISREVLAQRLTSRVCSASLAASYLVRPGGQSIQPCISATNASCIAGRDGVLRYALLSGYQLLLGNPLLLAFLSRHFAGVL